MVEAATGQRVEMSGLATFMTPMSVIASLPETVLHQLD
jgi:hypothetical protein